MNLPTIIVNFKTYEAASGEKALELAKMHEEVAKKTGVQIAVCVQAVDLFRVASVVNIPVFAQHIDSGDYGANTGHIIAGAVKQAGASGTLLNHAEMQIPMEDVENSIKSAKNKGLISIVCANNTDAVKTIQTFKPDFIALEPPELIGGDVSVSKAQPEIIQKAVEVIGDGELLVGAGVKNGNDVKKALELGAKGVLLASGVVKAKNRMDVLYDLAKGLL